MLVLELCRFSRRRRWRQTGIPIARPIIETMVLGVIAIVVTLFYRRTRSRRSGWVWPHPAATILGRSGNIVTVAASSRWSSNTATASWL